MAGGKDLTAMGVNPTCAQQLDLAFGRMPTDLSWI